MGRKYAIWQPRTEATPSRFDELKSIILQNRNFAPLARLDYGDHGMGPVVETVLNAIESEKRIALYADYDVDGTMSCVSWIWFFRELGFENFVHYIPCRQREGYGVNLKAIEHLIENEKAELIITMDTGITANAEAAYCKSRGVDFICTDHHVIQTDKMPDSIILNPKMHPNPEYQELCGCGITFVLLRKLGQFFPISADLWTDLLALAGMATICDVVPLNGVNHKLARQGVDALLRSNRPILRELRRASSLELGMDEKDVGFRIGPRINAVGRLDHADKVVEAFINEDPKELVAYMSRCNDERRTIQDSIVREAMEEAKKYPDAPLLFLGGNWHHGVVGIAASKLAETLWRPVFLFDRKETMCRGSARTILGFDVTEAMAIAKGKWTKFGGHRAAGGFSFDVKEEAAIRALLTDYAEEVRTNSPEMWRPRASYDCSLSWDLFSPELLDLLDGFRPFGNAFDEPRFVVEGEVEEIKIVNDKKTGQPRHSFVFLTTPQGTVKVNFFNEVVSDLAEGNTGKFLVSVDKNIFRGHLQMNLMGIDRDMSHGVS